MDWHDQQDLARYRRRKRKQREYQATYRGGLKEAKVPERDEMAAELMRVYLDVIAIDHAAGIEFTRRLIAGLTDRGFERTPTVQRIRAMASRARAKLLAKADGGQKADA